MIGPTQEERRGNKAKAGAMRDTRLTPVIKACKLGPQTGQGEADDVQMRCSVTHEQYQLCHHQRYGIVIRYRWSGPAGMYYCTTGKCHTSYNEYLLRQEEDAQLFLCWRCTRRHQEIGLENCSMQRSKMLRAYGHVRVYTVHTTAASSWTQHRGFSACALPMPGVWMT